MTMGEITSKVERATAAAIKSRFRQASRTNQTKTAAHGINRNSGFSRSQHAKPSKAPDAIAQRIDFILAARIKHQTPPSTNQLVGESAFGVAPENASKGDSAASPPAVRPTGHPHALTPIPTTNNTASESSDICTY